MKVINLIRRILGTSNLNVRIEENNRILHELNWAQIFNNTIAGSDWLLDQSFSPGRYAVGYPFLYVLYRILDEIKPKNILEFGLGQSSKMLYQYAKSNDLVGVTTIENDNSWVQFYERKNKIPANVKLEIAEIDYVYYNNHKTLSIKDVKKITNDNLYDFILVDGPFGSERYSRSQIIELLPENLEKKGFCIIIDDYNRPGEKDTCFEIEKKFKANNIAYCSAEYSGIKSCKIYCSSNLKYLTTL